MQALISLHHPQYLERAAKSTEVWKTLWGWVKVRNVWPSAGSLGPGFYNWPLRSQNRALQLGLAGLSWALNVMLRKITSNKIISWWKVLEMRGISELQIWRLIKREPCQKQSQVAWSTGPPRSLGAHHKLISLLLQGKPKLVRWSILAKVTWWLCGRRDGNWSPELTHDLPGASWWHSEADRTWRLFLITTHIYFAYSHRRN